MHPSPPAHSKAKAVVDQLVVPVLQYAEQPYEVVPTTHRGFATEHVRDMGAHWLSWFCVVWCACLCCVVRLFFVRCERAREKSFFGAGGFSVVTARHCLCRCCVVW
jgi:hypothetical protein